MYKYCIERTDDCAIISCTKEKDYYYNVDEGIVNIGDSFYKEGEMSLTPEGAVLVTVSEQDIESLKVRFREYIINSLIQRETNIRDLIESWRNLEVI